jgi:hypothetical protein
MENSSYNGTISNNVSGMTATNVASGDGAEANSASVVMKNRSGNGALNNNSGSDIVINNVTIPFGGLSGQNINAQAGGGTSNKDSVVYK